MKAEAGMQAAVCARFPHFEQLFVYGPNGDIFAVRGNFVWNGRGHDTVRQYILYRTILAARRISSSGYRAGS
jgi:hypothetical protein